MLFVLSNFILMLNQILESHLPEVKFTHRKDKLALYPFTTEYDTNSVSGFFDC